MANLLLSPSEKVFILHGVQDDYRSDGRSNIDYRPMELETDVVSHASGSARLRLANTDILVGVKTEIDVPKPDKPNLGKIEFFVDCSANATPEFEGRGGEQLANSIAHLMQRAYHSAQAFDLQQLSILEGKQCWKLYIDILILESGGNLCDAVSLAVKAALFNTRIPLVKAALMDGGNVDLQLSDDPYDSKLLDVGSAPLLVTLCKIGDKCVVDPSAEEESCSVISLVVGVSGNPRHYTTDTLDSAEGGRVGVSGNRRHYTTDTLDSAEGGRVGVSGNPRHYTTDTLDSAEGGRCTTIAMNGPGSVAPKTLKDAINQGIIAAKSLDEALGDALLRERNETIGLKKHSYGFLK